MQLPWAKGARPRRGVSFEFELLGCMNGTSSANAGVVAYGGFAEEVAAADSFAYEPVWR